LPPPHPKFWSCPWEYIHPAWQTLVFHSELWGGLQNHDHDYDLYNISVASIRDDDDDDDDEDGDDDNENCARAVVNDDALRLLWIAHPSITRASPPMTRKK
jgi:hypothetical protein